MSPGRAVVAVIVLMFVASTVSAAPLRLPKLGIEIEADASWRIDPANTEVDAVLIGESTTPVTLVAAAGGACRPGPQKLASCPDGFSCWVTELAGVEVAAYCTQVPGGALQVVRPHVLERLDYLDSVRAILSRSRDALTTLRSTTPWVQHATVSGLDLAIGGTASWQVSVDPAFDKLGKGPERVDFLERTWPAPPVQVWFAMRGNGADCEEAGRALREKGVKEVEQAKLSEVAWIFEIGGEKADGTGTVHAQTSCLRTRKGVVLVLAAFEGEGSYGEVLTAIIRAPDHQTAADVTDTSSSYVETTKSLQMGRFYVQGFAMQGETIEDRYGARVGLELWADLDAASGLSKMFGFGLSGSANSKAELGFDARIAFGGGIDADVLKVGLLATAGADRVIPAEGPHLYIGAEALMSIAIGGASLAAAAQWNTREYRGFVQLRLSTGLAIGGELTRFHDAMFPADMFGLYVGVAP